MVPPDSDSLSRVESYSGNPLARFPCRLRGFHPLWPVIPNRSTKDYDTTTVLLPQKARPSGLGCSAVARRYTRNHGCFLFLQVLRCFSSLGWLGNHGIRTCLTASPCFSQSSTPYSLLVPRHPPHALRSLATLFTSSRRVTTPIRREHFNPLHFRRCSRSKAHLESHLISIISEHHTNSLAEANTVSSRFDATYIP